MGGNDQMFFGFETFTQGVFNKRLTLKQALDNWYKFSASWTDYQTKLFSATSNVPLAQGHTVGSDTILWRWNPNGHYSASSIYKHLSVAGNVFNLSTNFISIFNVVYKAKREGSVDDIEVRDIVVQLVNAGDRILCAAIIHNDVISWSFATANFVLICIYFGVYWKYASSDQKKKIGGCLAVIAIVAGLFFRTFVLPNIIPFLYNGISRDEVNQILNAVISALCSFYVPISFWHTNMMVVSFPTGSRSGIWFYSFNIMPQVMIRIAPRGSSWKIVPLLIQIMQILSCSFLLSYAGLTYNIMMMITNIVGIIGAGIYMILWSIHLYILCRNKERDLERGETSLGTTPSSCPQTQPEPVGASLPSQLSHPPAIDHEEGAAPTSRDSTLSSIPNMESETPNNLLYQTLAIPTGSVEHRKSTTVAISSRTSTETQNELAPDMKCRKLDPSTSALASPLSPLLHSSEKEEGAAPASVNSTLSSIPNVKSETPNNLKDQTLATPIGSADDHNTTTAAISSCASSATQNKSALDMKHHELDPSDSALASPLSPLLHSHTKEEGAAPTSVYSTLSSIPNVENETSTNLPDQNLATSTGSADDCKSTTAAICSHNFSKTQNKSAPGMKRHELDPSASALASPLSPLPYFAAREDGAAPTYVYSTHSSIPNVKSETPTNLQYQTLATLTGSVDDCKSAAAVNSSLAYSETQNHSAPHIKRPILDGGAPASALTSTSSPFHHSTKEGNVASPSFLLPVSTVTEQTPFVDGPSPYQGLHGQPEGGLLGATPKSFTLTAPAA